MLELIIEASEFFDETTEEFVSYDKTVLRLEYSLASLSKWEFIWEVPFLQEDEHGSEETRSFVECMCLDPNVPPEVFSRLDQSHFDQVAAYVQRKATATFFSNVVPEPKSGETVTAELIYYWMSTLDINWEAQYWHINKLFTLIKVFNLKNADQKKMTPSEARARTRALNAQRRAQFESSE